MATRKPAKRSTAINPLVGDTPSETITNAVGALEWLNALDGFVGEAFGGEPIDSITYGRFLLGKCCSQALTAAGHELDEKAVRHEN